MSPTHISVSISFDFVGVSISFDFLIGRKVLYMVFTCLKPILPTFL